MTAIRERIHFESRIRNERVAAILGIALGVTFSVCFATGLYSHFLQDQPCVVHRARASCRSLSVHARPPCRNRSRVDSTALRQALVRLSEALHLATVLRGCCKHSNAWP